ncbi:TetR/AcrR family transcriptional regulator [Sporolactobacillus sp. STSJ-5]|uniref:TetR/AcrR family transcriptional regulator n=1 Tax=Sporolactobacillus sp. STSJ-5 TaxID=2965076 RepID=UPI00210731B6|nr:TetR/AcrR family transcriptional regulator [Sporolactobacillus sp. STSJ-5]MCQ2011410.1 TetR/AcrR family transcriptional regulator [Sporolactobacillus sp. STSJ-5]
MKSDEIKAAAVKYFTIYGYEGASLAQIGEEVGMKKQSIYAHFKGKDDLFLHVLQEAKEEYLYSKIKYFRDIDAQHPEKDLYGFLTMMIDLFQKNEQLKFWLRVSFFPPVHLTKVIDKEVDDVETQVRVVLEEKFQGWIDHKKVVDDSAKRLTLAFLGVVDSILVELVYGNDEKTLKEKLDASWRVFWRGIQ